MSDVSGAAAPDDAAGPGPGAPGPPQRGGLLAALQQQQQGPQASAPGEGDQGNAMMLIKNGLDLLQQALGSLDHSTPIYRDTLNAMSRITRHLSQGAPTAGVQQTQLGDLLRMVMRTAMLQKLRGQQGQAGGGQQAQPPMPSTPLPGA